MNFEEALAGMRKGEIWMQEEVKYKIQGNKLYAVPPLHHNTKGYQADMRVNSYMLSNWKRYEEPKKEITSLWDALKCKTVSIKCNVTNKDWNFVIDCRDFDNRLQLGQAIQDPTLTVTKVED